MGRHTARRRPHGGRFRARGALAAFVAGLAVVVLPAVPVAASTPVTIAAHLQATSVGFDQPAHVLGTVTPAGATPRVVVQRSLGGGRWSDVQAGAVATNGSFNVSFRFAQAGPYALRVRSNGGSVHSPTFYLHVGPSPFAPFVGTWFAHETELVFSQSGAGYFLYPDLTRCPNCSLADAPVGWLGFVVTALVHGVATGKVTSSSDAQNWKVGASFKAWLGPASPGWFLYAQIGAVRIIPWCNAAASATGQCGA